AVARYGSAPRGDGACLASRPTLPGVAVLGDLLDELSDLRSRLLQRTLPQRRDAVVLAHLALDDALLALEVSVGLEAVQERVQRPGRQLVLVARQLLEEPHAVQGALARVVQHVDLDESEE